MEIGPLTRLAALIGDPVKQSFSPMIHNAAYRFLGVDAVYLAIRVPYDDLRDAVLGLRALGAMGVNVTLPHKQTVLELLDDVRSDARAIGAVNTIVMQENDGAVRLVGENTDVTGFLMPLAEVRDRIHDQSAVIFGAGGAARAVLYACQTSLRTAHVAVVVRNQAQGERMAEALAVHSEEMTVSVLPFEEAASAVSEAALVVNTTPVGMYPDVHESPWPSPSAFRQGQIVYDLVYNPVETRFLQEAESRGAVVLNGLEMLIAQAAAAHTLWTGLRMPVEEVRNVVLSSLRR